jgi:hypothetical protein
VNPLRKAADYRHRHTSKGWKSVHGFRKSWPKKEAGVERSYRHAVNVIIRAATADLDSLTSKSSAIVRRRIKKDSSFLAERIRQQLQRKVKTEYGGYVTGGREAGSGESDLIDKLFSLAGATSLYAAAVSRYLEAELILPVSSVCPAAQMKLRERFANESALRERLMAWSEQSKNRFPDIYGPQAMAPRRSRE